MYNEVASLTDNYDDEKVQHILKLYKQRREKQKEKYQLIKDTEEFKTKNRARAKEHYHKNKHLKQQSYENNKEFIKFKTHYRYYEKQNRIDEFKKKFPERYMYLVDRNYFTLA